ncbi:secondary thiamine-phosphate synthase enzyme YjbQ [Synechococcus sp. WH 8016]|uniref:secondary thiamine-phosphate synthase enzyme YjbQ n=1 Tax=Synechococcus sp. WH 8016 TaxID=166318 RepID=UPI00030F1117|nr:secondary thiamine-phosphate synthase enzyme YjbQ [Synechococcus sp. WH 8016]
MTHQLLSLRTEAPFQCLSITTELRRFVQVHGGQDGAVVVSGQHTTTAVIINEMEERLLMDLQRWLSQQAPPGANWKHDDLELRRGIPDDEPRNAHAHLQALMLGNEVTVNVRKGALQLGQYQEVMLVELDGPRQRRVSLQWLSA